MNLARRLLKDTLIFYCCIRILLWILQLKSTHIVSETLDQESRHSLTGSSVSGSHKIVNATQPTPWLYLEAWVGGNLLPNSVLAVSKIQFLVVWDWALQFLLAFGQSPSSLTRGSPNFLAMWVPLIDACFIKSKRELVSTQDESHNLIQHKHRGVMLSPCLYLLG